MTRWKLSLGPAAVFVDIDPALGLTWTPSAGEGLYDLQPCPDVSVGAATITAIRASTGDASRVAVDAVSERVTVHAVGDDLSAQDLAYLSYLVLESRLHRHGIVTLHAAAVEREGQAVLLLGHPGAGKTTTALRLCRDHGFALLGNDLVVIGGEPPQVFAGTRFIRLRQSSVVAALPELSHLFPAVSADPWRSKIDVSPAQAGVRLGVPRTRVAAVVFVHADPTYSDLIDSSADTLVHRLNLHENAVRYIRGASTPWLIGPHRAFGPYVPSFDTAAAHAGRTATLERLLPASRYVAGPPQQVASRISDLCRTPVVTLPGGSS